MNPTPEEPSQTLAASNPEPASAPVPGPAHHARIHPKAHFSIWLVWLVPVVAVVIGLWLGVKSVLSHGPTITISFPNADGLEAGKTKIKYKNVDIGLVKTIQLAPDHQSVEVTAELEKSDSSDRLIASDSRFWVVRPQVTAGGISGLGTLLSGAYIGMDIGKSETTRNHFKGLDVPPIVTADLQGGQYKLQARSLGSLSIGSPLYFRRIQVGQVVAFDLDSDGKQVAVTVFVNAPYDRFVSGATRFWHASGVDLALDANGVHFNTESLISLVAGGIAFEDVATGDTALQEATTASVGTNATGSAVVNNAGNVPVPYNTVFSLHPDRATALKQPDSWSFDYVLLFDSSVRGLSVGAPVEFRGLPIGQVTDIRLNEVLSDKPKIAVTMRVYPSRLPRPEQDSKPIDSTPAGQMKVLPPMITKGFRAQLRNGNLLTGALYVALDFFPNAPAATIDWKHKPAIFPTLPGSLDSLQASLTNIVEKLDRLPLEKIATDLNTTLRSTNAAIQHTDALVQSLGSEVGQLTPEARKLMQDARTTLATLNQTLNSVEKTVRPDSDLTVQTTESLEELRRAAKSLRELSDYLQRHPESLLRGKPQDAP